MPTWKLGEHFSVVVTGGDLTDQDVDAIVNAANPSLLGGGGVDGAIHRAAGPRLLAACQKLPIVEGVRCKTAEARITPGFDLPARHVIHTVGPIYDASPDPEGELSRTHRACLALADRHGLRSIAFPAISCGAFGYPMALAAPIAVGAASRYEGPLEEIRFVLRAERDLQDWTFVASKVLGTATLGF